MQPDLSANAPWKTRFLTPHIGLPQIAANNPQRGVVFGDQTGVFQLYAWDVPNGAIQQITDIPGGTTFGGISPDGEFIYYLNEQHTGHYVRVPFGGGTAEDITPDLLSYSSNFISQSLNGQKIGLTSISEQGFQCWVISVDGTRLSAPQLIYQSEQFAIGPLLNHDGDVGVIATVQQDSLALMAFQLTDTTQQQNVKVLHESDGMLFPVAFAPLEGYTHLLATTTASGLQRPVIWDVESGDRIDLPLDGVDGDLQAWGWSSDGQKLLLKRTFQAVDQLFVYDLERSTFDAVKHPAGIYDSGAFMPDSLRILVDFQASTQPNCIATLDLYIPNEANILLSADDTLLSSKLLKSVSFESARGVQIQGWLGKPEGNAPFPAVIYLHDGPSDVLQQRYLPEAQAWLDHGVVFLGINYRGSSTFGDEFEGSIYGFPGHREVDDAAAAYHWLVEQGIALENAVFMDGTGYGGYLVLQALGRTPDLWAGGIAEPTVTDWKAYYESVDDSLRQMQVALFGGSPDEVPEQTRAASPMTYVDAVEAPLLFFSRQNDPVYQADQHEEYISALQEQGKQVSHILLGLGADRLKPNNQIKQVEAKLGFISDVLAER